jgi:DNA adenine methylase
MKQGPKPILKWVGGKTQILEKVMSHFPKEMQDYREIFLGGGSVLFALLHQVKQGNIKVHGRIYAYDVNEPLIYMYKNIQHHHEELYAVMKELIDEFNRCEEGKLNRNAETLEEAKQSKENYYYWIRRQYNQLDKRSIQASALFIFLNKTCFRGVFRVGPNGFNVPYGHNKNPEIVNPAHLEEIHQLIQPVQFECCDFTQSLVSGTHDFVYLDPPYAPETPTSFVGYTEHGFPLEKHLQLCKQIHALEGKFLMSNADVPLIREQFPPEKYRSESLLCKRAIHSKHPDAKAKEVLLLNYGMA